MSQTGHLAAEDVQAQELRFRASFISSVALHFVGALALLVGPLIGPRQIIMPAIAPVLLVMPSLPSETPQPRAAMEPESQPEPQPEPQAVITTEPEPIPREIEELPRSVEPEPAATTPEPQPEVEQQPTPRPQQATRQTASRHPPAAPATPQAARRSSIDVIGTGPSDSSMTVEDFPFAYYLEILRQKVGERWTPPPRGPYSAARSAQVYFRIDRNGRLALQPQVTSDSGDSLFDQSAQRAIFSAAPFPPLPQVYEGNSLGVRFAFVQE